MYLSSNVSKYYICIVMSKVTIPSAYHARTMDGNILRMGIMDSR